MWARVGVRTVLFLPRVTPRLLSSLVWCSDPLGAKVGQEADRASHQPDPQVSPRPPCDLVCRTQPRAPSGPSGGPGESLGGKKQTHAMGLGSGP